MAEEPMKLGSVVLGLGEPGDAPIVAECMTMWDMADHEGPRFGALLSERLKRDPAFRRAFHAWSVQTLMFFCNERAWSAVVGVSSEPDK